MLGPQEPHCGPALAPHVDCGGPYRYPVVYQVTTHSTAAPAAPASTPGTSGPAQSAQATARHGACDIRRGPVLP